MTIKYKLLEDRDGMPRVFDDLEDLVEYIVTEDDISHDGYDELIYEYCGKEISIFGIKFDPVYILKELDPVAYRCGFSAYIESVLEDKRWEVEKDLDRQLGEPGDTADYDLYEIVAIGEEEEA